MAVNLKRRYLFVGGVNTIFGYVVGIIIYMILKENFHIAVIATFVNLITITFSFITYKLFVFETKGAWISEYFKSYFVYGVSALISILLLWVFVDKLKLNIYLSQAATIITTVIVSYVGHRYFTFKK